MRRLLLSLALLLTIGAGCADAALAFGSSIAAATTTGATITSPSLTVTGTNPVIAVGAIFSSTTTTVSTLSWSLGGGTPVQVTLFRGGAGNDTAVVWVIPAPTAGTGTVTLTLSASATSWRYVAAVFTGADQTTPATDTDSATSNAAATSTTVTAKNLTANDGSFFVCGDNSSNISAITPNQLLVDNTTASDTGVGYALGTASLTATYSDTAAHPNLVVRLIAASGGGGCTAPANQLMMLGVGNCHGDEDRR